jgi:hypothetical protein
MSTQETAWRAGESAASVLGPEAVKPPPLGSKRHPALGDAPGEYVRG